MRNCKDIENSLPLYTEGLLSADEKMDVEEHLKSCSACAKAFAQLQRSGTMVQELKEVEPPPWFKQKIMARVRDEAEKKSIAQRWLYPLRMKIPVQIMATIVIAVFAVYIYRSGDEQMKAILPGVQQPAIEAQKEQASAEMPKARSGDKEKLTSSRKKAVVREEVVKDKQVTGNMASGSGVQKSEVPESKPKAAYKADAYKAKRLAEIEKAASLKLQVKQDEQQSLKKQIAAMEREAEDQLLSSIEKNGEADKIAAPVAPRSLAASVAVQHQTSITLHVVDVNSALIETEKILTKYQVRKVTKQLIDGKAILRAEFSVKHIKDILSQLRSLGRVEEKNIPAESGEQDVAVVIEIHNQ